MGAVNKLTATAVKSKTKRGLYGDGKGLWLQISKWKTKSWIFRFMLDGKARSMGLGPVKQEKNDGGVTLEEAREERDKLRKMLRAGIDPIENRKAEHDNLRAEVTARITFKDAAAQFIEVHEPTWKNPKHRQQWRNTLKTYAFPRLGDRPVSAIDDALINQAVADIWLDKQETASRVRNRIQRIVKWIADGRPLPQQSKARRVKHHGSLLYKDMPAFMERLRGRNSISARALEFLVLTATRTGATIGARWSEIDFDAKLWTILADREGTKTDVTQRVPLSARVISLLEKLPLIEGSDFIFPGAREGKPLSDMAMLELLRGMEGKGFTVHGFRSSFETWAAEKTNFADAVVNAAGWHVIENKVKAAYQRGDLLEKRRRLMDAWDSYCASPPAEKGKVLSMHGQA